MTIKEISELIGISKVSLYALLKKPEYSSHISKSDGITVVDSTGVALIRAYYANEKEIAFKDVFKDELCGLQPINNDIIGFLQEQLKEKDNQINALLTIVKSEQQLKAMPLLVNPEDKIKKGGFFRRLFAGRKDMQNE